MEDFSTKVKDFLDNKVSEKTKKVVIALLLFVGIVVVVPYLFKFIALIFSILASIFVPVVIIIGLAVIGLYVYHTVVKNKSI